MGFLDNSTNNIIIDAVLTDVGRSFLAANNGSFSIVKFALGDDEVDYTIIRQYGTTIGKEKIIKNTPIFEAQTHANLGIKHKCLSLSAPNLLRMPLLATNLAGLDYLSMTTVNDASANKKNVTVHQSLKAGTILPEMLDGLYEVKMNNRFLTVTGQVPIVDSNNIGTYLLNSTGLAPEGNGGSSLSFQLATRPINNFTQFATYTDSTIIKTSVTVKGFFSGAEKIIDVQIKKNS